MRQGADKKTEFGEGGFPFDPKEISAVLLTHAHIDHSGLIPLLVKRGFGGRVIATNATCELSTIMLPDSGYIQEQEAEYQNRKNARSGKPPIEPLYGVQDAIKALQSFSPVTYEETVEMLGNVTARFVDAGHLLGSASVEIEVKEGENSVRIAFSGDIGRDDSPIICDPKPVSRVDYLVMEGTYGDRDHNISSHEEKEERFASVVKAALRRGGNILIPSFAVGRTQTMLYFLRCMIDKGVVPGLENIPIYVDSPLGIEATRIFQNAGREYYDDEAKALSQNGDLFDIPNLRFTKTSDESKLINAERGAHIIISSSGMCDAGRIRHHLKHNLYRADSTVIFVGYQASGTLGRMLLNGVKKVKLFGEEVRVNAAIEHLEGFSGHAGRSELLKWLTDIKEKPRQVFLTHGEEEVLGSLGKKLQELGYPVHIPTLLDEFELTGQKVLKAASEKAARVVSLADFASRRQNIVKQAQRIATLLDIMPDGGDDDMALKLRIMEHDVRALADKWSDLLNS